MTFESIDRRRMLSRSGMGLGMLALAGILNDESQSALVSASEPIAGNSLSPRPPHFPARAKRVIHLFANGGPSQIDTFDPKPDLAKFAGKTLSDKLGRDRRLGGVGHPSSFKFSKHGECGTEVSELFPNIAKHVDK
ncbi:DUF1501 domain-containing protein, partial [Novipirellula sp.]|uniref:DUF1501 domain-containing protein n=1 Tax=Novipirellula sp. TaxID=2795430 RepID=UPI00356A3B53